MSADGSGVDACSDPPVSLRSGISAPGTFTYQVLYRSAANFCTNATFNLTNGLTVKWAP